MIGKALTPLVLLAAPALAEVPLPVDRMAQAMTAVEGIDA